jgi:hypothetical protein
MADASHDLAACKSAASSLHGLEDWLWLGQLLVALRQFVSTVWRDSCLEGKAVTMNAMAETKTIRLTEQVKAAG